MIVKRSKEEFASYLEDTSNLQGSATALYIPRDAAEVSSVVRECMLHHVPLTVSGGGTGTTGGRVPLEGALVSLEALDKIKDINVQKNTVLVQAGVRLADLEKELNCKKLTLRAQPTEPLAFIGGVIANSASGPRSFKYDSIRRYVRGLGIVLSDGEYYWLERGTFFAHKRNFSGILKHGKSQKNFKFTLPSYTSPKIKSSAGYFVAENMDFIDLFIGQEGTLGVIVDAELFVQPLVFDVFNCIVFFPSEDEALRFVDYTKSLRQQRKNYPCSLEFFDRNSLNLLEEFYPSLPRAECAVYFEQEIEQEGTASEFIDFWCGIVQQYGASLDQCWFAETSKDRERLYEFRHKLPSRINEILRSHKQLKMATDIAVADESFRQMYAFYKEKAEESQISYVNFGHIGQNHLHFNFLPKNDEESFRAKGFVMEFIKRAIALKGTISAEHGIGKIKRPYLEIMYGKKHLKEMAKLKKTIDPLCLFGLDTMFAKDFLV